MFLIKCDLPRLGTWSVISSRLVYGRESGTQSIWELDVKELRGKKAAVSELQFIRSPYYLSPNSRMTRKRVCGRGIG